MKLLQFREATIDDIDDYMVVRMAVRENILNTPSLVPKDGEIKFLTVDGKGWVCECEDKIVGFAIVGLKQRNIWALFVHPEYEKMGIGKTLHDMMMKWYFSQTKETVWLSTDPNTKAALFYKKLGWEEKGMAGSEMKFEMNYANYISRNIS